MTPRYDRILQLISSHGLDGVVINPGPSFVYMTGLFFHLSERPTLLLITAEGRSALVHPRLETPKLASSSIPLEGFPFDDDPSGWPGVIARSAQSLNLSGKKIGVEPNRLRVLEWSLLQTAAPDCRLVPAGGLFADLRILKDAGEIESVRRAARIAESALSATLPLIKPGISEREVAAELVFQLLRAGSDPELPFMPIVSGGPNSANPHAVPTERLIQRGDLLVIDFGAAYQGYASDITRTFAIGETEPELEQIYAAVLAANAAGRAAGRPGLRAGQIDDAARGVIAAAGYADYFTHRTGHGLGMEGHEAPYLFAANEQVLEPGMLYTVEPGIYLPDRGGVRIEDDVVVTPGGSESLTIYPREWNRLAA